MIRGEGVPRHLPSVWMWVASAAGVRTLAAEGNDKHRGETQVVTSSRRTLRQTVGHGTYSRIASANQCSDASPGHR
jgi:hypothetical protein